MLFRAVVWMNLALIFYTWAVFSGRRHGLQTRHLIVFGIGLTCDYLGTHDMTRLTLAYDRALEWHYIAGMASLSGMAFHFLLALAATILGRAAAANRIFHRVSLTIYTCWLIVFASGAIYGMLRLYR
jgi:uncharacterized repeat protein (TIGR03987 family)